MLKEKIKELRRAVKKLGIFNCDIKPVNKILFEIIEEAEDIMWIRELYYYATHLDPFKSMMNTALDYKYIYRKCKRKGK